MNRSKRALLRLIQTRALRRGDFTLASGKTSTYYIDMRKVSVSSEGAYLIGKVLAKKIDPDVDSIGGLQVGAVPLVAATVARCHMKGRVMEGFWVRDQVKGHGTGGLVAGTLGLRSVILDDVCTTGGSAFKAIQSVREYQGEVVGVIALVDRLEGAQEFFKDQGIPFLSIFDIHQVLGTEKLAVD